MCRLRTRVAWVDDRLAAAGAAIPVQADEDARAFGDPKNRLTAIRSRSWCPFDGDRQPTASFSVLLTRHPRSAISIKLAHQVVIAVRRDDVHRHRLETFRRTADVPTTDTRTFDTSASRVFTAASSVLRKQPPSEMSRYSPPRKPRSLAALFERTIDEHRMSSRAPLGPWTVLPVQRQH